MTAATDILIFAEDPGAANYVAELPERLRARGWRALVVTCGTATNFLSARGVAAHPLQPDCNADELVSQFKPRLLIVGTSQNPDTLGFALAAAAKVRRIPVVGLVDASTGPEERFRGRGGNPLQHCPQLIIVPDSVSRDGFRALGVPPDRVLVAGHPHWDYVRKKRGELQKADRAELRESLFGAALHDRRVVVFGAEIYDGLDEQQHRFSAEYRLTGDSGNTGRTEIVVEEFLRAMAPRRRDVHLVLRLHPKNQADDLSAYHSAFDTVSRSEPALDVLYAADSVAGMTSMLMIEAALLWKPTLAILPRACEATWLPTIAAGITPCALSRQSIAEQIGALIDQQTPPVLAALDRLFPIGALEIVVGAVEACLSGHLDAALDVSLLRKDS
jgi:hypothetical protein